MLAISAPVMTAECSELLVCTDAPSATTFTVSVTAPISRRTSPSDSLSFAERVTPDRRVVLNPTCSILIEYVSGCTAAKLKVPDSFDLAVRTSPVWSLVSVITAPGTISPAGSLTVPVIDPVTVICAAIGARQITARQRPAKIRREIDIDTPSLLQLEL